jgi:hypothetical protein
MAKCGFYACDEEGTVDATFSVVGGVHRMHTKLCALHDRHTRAGGDLAVLFQRVDPPARVGYASPSGADSGANPPTTGGM